MLPKALVITLLTAVTNLGLGEDTSVIEPYRKYYGGLCQ